MILGFQEDVNLIPVHEALPSQSHRDPGFFPPISPHPVLPRQTSKGGPCLSNSSFLIFSPRRRWQVKGPLLLTVSLSIVQQLEKGASRLAAEPLC